MYFKFLLGGVWIATVYYNFSKNTKNKLKNDLRFFLIGQN